MKQSTKTLLATIGLTTIVLSGCKQDDSVDYLLHHPNKLQQTIHQCEKMDAQTQIDSKICQSAASASQQLVPMLREQASTPRTFGMKILKAQDKLASVNQQLVNLKEELKAADTETGKSQLKANVQAMKKQQLNLVRQINLMYLVIRTVSPAP